MTMLDEVRQAALRVGSQRRLRAVLSTCRRLLSVRGEANSVAIGRELLAGYDALDERTRRLFFGHLAADFNPDPKAVEAAAKAYAAAPGAATLAPLVEAAEPPRQELLQDADLGRIGVIQFSGVDVDPDQPSADWQPLDETVGRGEFGAERDHHVAATEAALSATVTALRDLDSVNEVVAVMRVEGDE